jgi:Protease inhibitor Inh
MRWNALLLAAVALAGCASSLNDVPGRWEMHNHNNCALIFSGGPDNARGTVTATGLCPQVFSALPQWRIDGGRVVISNRRGETLAEFEAGLGRLDGRTAAGESISLRR